MGFTRHWTRRPADEPAGAFAVLAADARRIVQACNAVGVRLAGPLGTGQVVIDDEIIAFNGVPGCETFAFERDVAGPDPVAEQLVAIGLYEAGDRPAFTKTRCEPYDLAVVAVLLRAQVHYGTSLTVDAEGGVHPGAVEMCARLFP